MNICNYDVKFLQDFSVYFRNKNLIPVVGSGLTTGLKAKRGTVPDGITFMNYMKSELIQTGEFEDEQLSHLNFSDMCEQYEDDDLIPRENRIRYLTEHFSQVEFPRADARYSFFSIDWTYIYSLNIDDAIERNTKYSKIIKPGHEVYDNIFENYRCLIKLHGDIEEISTYPDANKVFTNKEYACSIQDNTYLLNKLQNDFTYQNIVFVGCSLDDEIDLLTVNKATANIRNTDSKHKVFYLTTKSPDRFKQSKLKNFNITDVICFADYDSIYTFLVDAWKKSNEIIEGTLDAYANIQIRHLSLNERTTNQDYFYLAKNLYDQETKTVTYPSYQIERAVTGKINSNLSKHKIHIVQGGHFCGGSYLLAELVNKIKDRERYLFSGDTRVSIQSINALINKKNIVALFDIGAINREGLEYILMNSSQIHEHKNNFVIIIRNNDSDTLGIVKWKLDEEIISVDNYQKYDLNNNINSNSEKKQLKEINRKLPNLGILPYMEKTSFLDHLMRSQNELGHSGKFDNIHIQGDMSLKTLSALIFLAIKEKIYSSEMVAFAFDKELQDICSNYHPFVAPTFVDIFEKTSADLSSYKYVLNSKYWLYQELGKFAEKKRTVVVESFEYIIRKLIKLNGYHSPKTRDFILFDKLNEIFFSQKRDNIFLIMDIYKNLEKIMATDYQYLHQYAKGCLTCVCKEKGKKNKLRQLIDANEKATIAIESIENDLKRKNHENEKLRISLSHIRFTKARIAAKMANIFRYKDQDMNNNATLAIRIAWFSPHNNKDMFKFNSNSEIGAFMVHFKNRMNDLENDDLHDLINQIISYNINTNRFE